MMRSVIFIAIVFSMFFVFADGNAEGNKVDFDEVCKSFIQERDTFKADLETCQAELQKLQQDLKPAETEEEEEVPAETTPEAKAVIKTANMEKKVQASKAPVSVKKEVEKKAEAVYKSYVQEDGQALKKYAELENYLKAYISKLRVWSKKVDEKIAEIEKKTLDNSVNILVLKETDKIQDKEIVGLQKQINKNRIEFELFFNGGYSTVEKGVVKLGVGTLIPVAKGKFEIELAVAAGIAANKEMGMVEFIIATPIPVKEGKVSLFVVPGVNFQMVTDTLGVSGSDTLATQKNKIFNYSVNGEVGAKALFGENWFVNGKMYVGYAYMIDPKTYAEKNSFNLGFSLGGGVQF